MKVYIIVRDIIFLILWLAILCVGLFTAKMTDVIDSNLIYVNRKIPPVNKWEKPDNNSEQNLNEEISEPDSIEWYNEENIDSSESNQGEAMLDLNDEIE